MDSTVRTELYALDEVASVTCRKPIYFTKLKTFSPAVFSAGWSSITYDVDVFLLATSFQHFICHDSLYHPNFGSSDGRFSELPTK
jgi:hypothetical protein